jgi:hypothetical protein
MIEEYTKAQYGPETVPEGEPIFNVGLGWDYVPVYKFKNQGFDVLQKTGAQSNTVLSFMCCLKSI